MMEMEFEFEAPQYLESLEKAAAVNEEEENFFDCSGGEESSKADAYVEAVDVKAEIEEAAKVKIEEAGKSDTAIEPEVEAEQEAKPEAVSEAEEEPRVEKEPEPEAGFEAEEEPRAEQEAKPEEDCEIRQIKTARRLWSKPTTSDAIRDDLDLIVKQEDNVAEVSLSELRTGTFEGIELLPGTPVKKHTMMTRQFEKLLTPTLELRNRSVVRQDRIGARPCNAKNKLKRKASPVSHHLAGPPSKYLTLAEQAYHFQYDTPPRFHTKQPGGAPPRVDFKPIMPTIPMTPNLATKRRAVKREKELDTIVKAKEADQLIVKSEFCPPNQKAKKQAGRSEFKLPTLKEFNWTHKGKKEEPFHFKAKLLKDIKREIGDINVSSIYPEVEMKVPIVNGVPCVTPQDKHDRSNRSLMRSSSIYDRGMAMKRRKEEKMIKIREQENTIAVKRFRAKPIPSFVSSRRRSLTSQGRHSKCVPDASSSRK